MKQITKACRRLFLTASLVFMVINHAFADAPATEFYVIDSARLAALASDDSKLDDISRARLGEISVLRGSYSGGLSMITKTARFRIDARFTSSFPEAKEPIGYNISASTNPENWDICSEKGTAIKIGKQFVTENWRKLPFVVVIRFLDLKH